MVRLTVEEQKDYPTLPPDSIVHVKVDSVEQRTVQGNRGPWDKLEFKFKVLQVYSTGVGGPHVSNFDNLIGEFVYGSTPTKITDSQENKLRLWAEAILGRPIELGFELDTDYFLNRECRAVISNYDKKAINPVTQKPFVGHQVQSLLAMGGGVIPGGAPGGQAPQQGAPAGWGPPATQQPVTQQPVAQAPAQDPWAAQPQAPAAGDPWAPPQQVQQPVAQPQQGVQQPVGQPVGAPAGQSAMDWEEEPPF